MTRRRASEMLAKLPGLGVLPARAVGPKRAGQPGKETLIADLKEAKENTIPPKTPTKMRDRGDR